MSSSSDSLARGPVWLFTRPGPTRDTERIARNDIHGQSGGSGGRVLPTHPGLGSFASVRHSGIGETSLQDRTRPAIVPQTASSSITARESRSSPYYPFLSNRDSTSVGAETRCGRRSGSFSIRVVARRMVSVPIPTIVSNDGFETPDGAMDRVHDKRTFVISAQSIRIYRWRAYVGLLRRGPDTVSESVERSFLTAEQPQYVRYSRTKWSNKPNGYVAGSDAVVRGCIASRSMGRPGGA